MSLTGPGGCRPRSPAIVMRRTTSSTTLSNCLWAGMASPFPTGSTSSMVSIRSGHLRLLPFHPPPPLPPLPSTLCLCKLRTSCFVPVCCEKDQTCCALAGPHRQLARMDPKLTLPASCLQQALHVSQGNLGVASACACYCGGPKRLCLSCCAGAALDAATGLN